MIKKEEPVIESVRIDDHWMKGQELIRKAAIKNPGDDFPTGLSVLELKYGNTRYQHWLGYADLQENLQWYKESENEYCYFYFSEGKELIFLIFDESGVKTHRILRLDHFFDSARALIAAKNIFDQQRNTVLVADLLQNPKLYFIRLSNGKVFEFQLPIEYIYDMAYIKDKLVITSEEGEYLELRVDEENETVEIEKIIATGIKYVLED